MIRKKNRTDESQKISVEYQRNHIIHRYHRPYILYNLHPFTTVYQNDLCPKKMTLHRLPFFFLFHSQTPLETTDKSYPFEYMFVKGDFFIFYKSLSQFTFLLYIFNFIDQNML